MSRAVATAVLEEQIRTLKMPAVRRELESVARQARDDGWPYEEFLRELLDREIKNREQRAATRRLREARFPDVKTLDQIDWQALQGVSRPKIHELASAAFLDKAEDVVLAGPVGTGKTHLAIALGVEATRRGHRVLFFRAADLVQQLLEARDTRSLVRLKQKLLRARLVIIDELGFVPFDRVSRIALMAPPMIGIKTPPKGGRKRASGWFSIMADHASNSRPRPTVLTALTSFLRSPAEAPAVDAVETPRRSVFFLPYPACLLPFCLARAESTGLGEG